MMDEMFIMKHIERDGKRMLIYINIGTNDGMPKEVLEMMAICIHAKQNGMCTSKNHDMDFFILF